jgi:hypothetical protein
MLEIYKELERILILQEEVGYDFITSQKYNDQREWRTLGKFTKLLEQGSCEYPVYADKLNPPEPDFITYRSDRSEYKNVEVTEILEAGRKRTKEYLDAKESTDSTGKLVEKIDDPCSPFIKVLNDKFLKFYGDNCWLVIYHDISYAKITPFGFWHNTLVANVEKWRTSHLVDFSKCPHEAVFVINASQNALVKIFPSYEAIVPDKTDSGYTQILF